MQDIKGIAENLGLYIATMITASIIYGLAILPSIYAILLRKNPFRLLCCVAKPLLTGIGTASR
jgi:Na+/H+-dicarboxylate symporter